MINGYCTNCHTVTEARNVKEWVCCYCMARNGNKGEIFPLETVSPDKSNEIDISRIEMMLRDELTKHAMELQKRHEEWVLSYLDREKKKLLCILDNHVVDLKYEMSQKMKDRVEKEEVTSHGWQNFDSFYKNEQLVDDKTYAVRTKDAEGRWQSPHMAYWIAEENSFFLLHTASAIRPVVHQYCELPE